MKTMKLGLLGILALAFASTPAFASHHCVGTSLVDVASKAGSFKTLLTAVKAAGLEKTLKNGGPFTVFAPTDEAFAKIPAETLNALLKDKHALQNVLLYHVVSGKVPASVAVTLSQATMANGKQVNLEVADGSLFINDSKVINTDIAACNGIIHVIDAVLIP